MKEEALEAIDSLFLVMFPFDEENSTSKVHALNVSLYISIMFICRSSCDLDKFLGVKLKKLIYYFITFYIFEFQNMFSQLKDSIRFQLQTRK